MRNGRSTDYVVFSAFGGLVVLVVFALVQLNRIEKKLVVQSQEIRALGEATDRLSARGGSAERVSAATTESEPAPAHVLHPDVPNFLKPRTMHWPPPGATLDGTLTRPWWYGDPKGFNTLIENGAELHEEIETYAAVGLADRNNWGNADDWHGDLATRIEVTDDYKEFTAYLRPNVKWHPVPNLDLNSPKYAWLKGEHPVTAEDFVFTLDMMLHPQVENGAAKNYYAELESWKAVDEHTFVMRWKKKQHTNLDMSVGLGPIPKFLFSREEDGTAIPKETIGLKFNQHWYNNKGYVGCGPFRMVSYEPGNRIRLERNEQFFGEKPAIKVIDYPIYTDLNQTILKLKAHEISAGNLTPAQYREEIWKYQQAGQKPANSPFFDGRISCQPVLQPVYRYLGWNQDRPIFADKRVRQAMTYASNRAEIIEKVFSGLATPTTGPFLQTGPYYDTSIALYPFDLEQAKKLLAEAGWQDTDGDGRLDKILRPGDATRTPFEFTLLFVGTKPEYAVLANILKNDLLKIGVKMNIDAAEWSLMQKRVEEKNFDAVIAGWALGWDVDLYQLWHSSQADVPKGSNHCAFRNKEADSIIEKLRESFDPEERIALAHRFHRIVHEEQPYTFFFIEKLPFCTWNDVKGVVFSKVRPTMNALPWWVTRAAN